MLYEVITRKFNLEVYQKWPKYANSMIDDKGRVQGLKFPIKWFEGEAISWIAISMREPYIAKAVITSYSIHYTKLYDVYS